MTPILSSNRASEKAGVVHPSCSGYTIGYYPSAPEPEPEWGAVQIDTWDIGLRLPGQPTRHGPNRTAFRWRASAAASEISPPAGAEKILWLAGRSIHSLAGLVLVISRSGWLHYVPQNLGAEGRPLYFGAMSCLQRLVLQAILGQCG